MRNTNTETSMEELKNSINSIKKAFIELEKTGFQKYLIYVAIQKCSQKYNNSYNPIPIQTIKAICNGLFDVDSYLFQKKIKRSHE